jgi:hypothetical protein
MEYAQRVATSNSGGEVFLLDDDRLVLGIGPILMPMTHRSLTGLANALFGLAKEPERFRHQSRIFVSCGRLTLRLTHQEFQDLLSLVGQTLTWLEARPMLRGEDPVH